MSDHDSSTTIDHGRLGRLGGFVHRHRGRVVLAWVAGADRRPGPQPLLRGTFQADFATKGSESERAATVLTQHFAGRSGDTVTRRVEGLGGRAGAADPGARAALPRRRQRLEGIGAAVRSA